MEQEQFLEVLDLDEAKRRFFSALPEPRRRTEEVALEDAVGRVLAASVRARVDVPPFDRADMDGFAVVAASTFGAEETAPRELRLVGEPIVPGRKPAHEVREGEAAPIATGAPLPRGADAVVPVEWTEVEGDTVRIVRPAVPGHAVTAAGSDVARGELALPAGTRISARESGLLAALGLARVEVFARPRVAVLSTGDEIVEPGSPLPPGCIYDVNARSLADAVRACGGEPVALGVVRDDEEELRARLAGALAEDVVVLSGGTSKGPGDVAYRVLDRLEPPGVLVHGVALKPGKPVCLALAGRTPVVVLPGFPASAVFTFHEFVAPLVRRLAGLPEPRRVRRRARVPLRLESARGRTEYLLVHLLPADDGPPAAWPLGKGSGSISTFARADGFVAIPRSREFLEADEEVDVTLLDETLAPRDLTILGSHCVGTDLAVERLAARGLSVLSLALGSEAGLLAARRGECDAAGVHLYDPVTGTYNEPFLTPDLVLVRGWRRMQGVVFRPDDARFAGLEAAEALRLACRSDDVVFVQRNRGSGTRRLVDELLAGESPRRGSFEVRTHNAVCAAVQSGRADLGVAIENVAATYGLSFLPLREERYDFVVPRARRDREPVRALVALLGEPSFRRDLESLGLRPAAEEA